MEKEKEENGPDTTIGGLHIIMGVTDLGHDHRQKDDTQILFVIIAMQEVIFRKIVINF